MDNIIANRLLKHPKLVDRLYNQFVPQHVKDAVNKQQLKNKRIKKNVNKSIQYTMPANRRRTNKSKTKRYRKRVSRWSGRKTMVVNRAPSLMSDRYWTKMKYSDMFTLTSVTSDVKSQLFSANSVFDPDQTGAGFKCLGHAEMGAFYDKYAVLASKIKIQATCSQANTINTQILVTPTLSAGVRTGVLSQFFMKPRAKTRICGETGNSTALTHYAKTKQQLGVSDVLDRQDLTSAIGADPSTQWYWLILSQGVDQATTATMFARITITYYVVYFKRKILDRELVSA